MDAGLTEEKIAAVTEYRTSSVFNHRERLAIEFAEKMALQHQSIDDGFFKRLRAEFSDAEIVELGMAIGQYIGFGRLLMVLDVERPVCSLEDP
ncbi:MAG: carboxymuconolactone decarboxylase family protein [Deltaproteobacteria bacterium]|nr:carboxymuconolactone decarboxylase family protein [Deltaproteobacteria bacterium]